MSTVKAGASQDPSIPPKEAPPPLPPALVKVLEAARDPDDRTRLMVFFSAAARAIDALGDLDLTLYEPGVTKTADLTVWESVAPIIGVTISDVNTLLSTVDSQIPEPDDGPEDLDEVDIFGGSLGGSEEKASAAALTPEEASEARVRDAMAAIHGIASVLRMEVHTFGQSIRNPQVMSDAWNLLDLLEGFRGKFRAGIGEMVFSAASSLANVEKEDVVPGYRQDIERSIGLRRAIALLAPWISRENVIAQKAAPSDGYTIRRQATKIGKLLDRFATSPAWTALRAADKQSLVKLRIGLQQALDDPNTYPADMRKILENLDRFLESMAVINHRETLVVHDRAALPRMSQTLEAAKAAGADGDDDAARLLFTEALDIGWRLIGRDPQLDDVTARARGLDPADLDAEDVALWAETLEERLVQVPVP